MAWGALAFALGVWLLQQAAVLPAPTFLLVVGSLGLLLALQQRYRWLIMIGCLLLGLGWAGGFAHWRLSDALPTEWEGRDIEVVGVVADLPQRFERGVRFNFWVEQAAGPVPKRIALSWYRQFDAEIEEEGDEEAAPDALPPPRAGERWRFLVRLKRPHGNLNPHGFDYEGWLLERGIRATGYVRKSALTGRLAQEAGGISGAIHSLRESIRLRMLRALPDQPYAGVLVALAIGDQQAIAPELWRLFAATGITHLMSISGLHVTMIGGLLALLVGWGWRRSARLPLLWPAQKAAAVAGLLGAAAYALLAGFGIPAQRTLFMLAIVVAAMISGRALTAAQVLGTALVVVLVMDPWAVLAAGFWLSFAAVALLFGIASGRVRRHWALEWLRAQWAITLGLIPALLALFQQFSLVSPLANALAIPLVSLLVTPLVLLGSLPGFVWMLDIAHALLHGLMVFLIWLAALPGALWQQHAPPPWTVPLAVIGALWLLLPRGFPARWLGAVLFLPLLFIVPERPGVGELHLTVLDVGQGQAIHVQTATHDLLYDTGPELGGTDAGARHVLPYLRAVGVQQLDALVISHADRDHAGGMASVLAGLQVKDVVGSIPQSRRCEDGASWAWDDVKFQFLHPAAVDYERKRSTNAMSCVLLIETSHGRVLIPGDIEGAAEAALLARHADALQADILIAPHHGGRKTATPEFVAAVTPREVIFPVGYRNRFGHPVPAVAERFAANGARLHRTDQSGAIRVRLREGMVDIVHERQYRTHYWHMH
ncbi:MAG: DNA internalization-related competence protein ComEC/Rec2 [Rhodocyclaceae bacterium]|nr:DNA internalization-related competence protein ComEC/Rec2 [Rhodocyclaceae bacterium]MDZ4213305.1 DNA internalization-related competence protein ComEC/Rec2 [Rhodocyclaceae bacterium]